MGMITGASHPINVHPLWRSGTVGSKYAITRQAYWAEVLRSRKRCGLFDR